MVENMVKMYLGGIGGCGKSTAGEIVSRRLGVPFFVGSEVRMKFAGVSTREELNAIPLEVRREMRRKAFDEVYHQNPELIMDGHFYLTDVDLAHLTHYVLLETGVDRAITFRRGDSTRVRSLKSDDIQAEMEELSQRAQAFEKDQGIKINRIENLDTISRLVDSLESAFTHFRLNGRKG